MLRQINARVEKRIQNWKKRFSSDSLWPPGTAAHQASLSITNFWSLLKLMSIELVMPSNHLILWHPLLLLPSILPIIRVFSNESLLHIRWPKYWSFSFSISPSNECSGLISSRMDWLDLLAVQGALKSLLQHHSSKASVLRCSAFFIVQLSHPYMTTGKTIPLTRWTFVSKVMSLFFNILCRLAIAFFSRSKHLIISWLKSPPTVILEPHKIKSVTVYIVSSPICHEVMGPVAMSLVFWMLSFKPTFSLSFTKKGMCHITLKLWHKNSFFREVYTFSDISLYHSLDSFIIFEASSEG